MTQWKIEHQGVRAVLATVAVEAQALDEQTSPQKLTKVMDDLAVIPAALSVVTQAVGDALIAQSVKIANIKSHVAAGQYGVVNAVACYDRAQLDMAAEVQTQAAAAATSGDFSFFIPEGAR